MAVAEDTPSRLITQAELLASATDADGEMLVASDLVISSGNGSLIDNDDGTWSFTAANNDDTLVDFSYTISDGIDSIAGIATLDITPVNDAPTATDGSFATDEDQVFEGDLARLVGDVDDDELEFSVIEDVQFGTLSLRPNGQYTYTPSAANVVADSFTFEVRDREGLTAQATVEIELVLANDPTEFVGPSRISLDEDSVAVFDWAAWFKNSNSESLVLSVLDSGAAYLEVTQLDNGQLQLSAGENANGVTAIVVQATDAMGESLSATVEVEVLPVNDTVAVSDQSLEFLDTQTISGVLIANTIDVDGESLSVIVSQPPENGQLTVNSDGTFTFEPNDGFVGVEEFRFVVSDGVAASDEAVVEIEILETPSLPFAAVIASASESVESFSESEETQESEDVIVATTANNAVVLGETFGVSSRNDSIIATNSAEVIVESSAPLQPQPILPVAANGRQLDRVDVNFSLTIQPAAFDIVVSNFDVEPQLDVINQPGLLWQELDSIRQSNNQEVAVESLAVGSVGTASSGLIVGYILWAIRSGWLISSIAATVPAWNAFDPLAIMTVADSSDSGSGETLEDIVETQKEKIRESVS